MTTEACPVVQEAPRPASLATASHLLSSFPAKVVDNLLQMQPFGTASQSAPGESMRYQGQSGIPTMQHMTGQMQGGLERARERLQQRIQDAADTLRVYVNQYPPLAALLFTLLVLSAVPVSAYVVFGLITTGIFLSIALIGFAFVEGFILLTSGGILMAILGGIALFTTIGFAVIGSIYLSYRGGCFLATNLWQAGSQIGGQVREAAQRVGQSMQPQSGPGSSQLGGAGMGGPSSHSAGTGGATGSASSSKGL